MVRNSVSIGRRTGISVLLAPVYLVCFLLATLLASLVVIVVSPLVLLYLLASRVCTGIVVGCGRPAQRA